MKQIVEGYFLKYGNAIWAVKGCFHPDGYAVALPRMYNGIKIKRLNDALELAKKNFPHLIRYVKELGFEVPLVPLKDSEILDPFSVSVNDNILLEFMKYFDEKLGVTGSYLYQRKGKDLDFLSFNKSHYLTLKILRERNITKPLNFVEESEVESLDYNSFKILKNKRVLEGIFIDKQYTFKIVECEDFGSVIDSRSFKGRVKIMKSVKPYSIPVKYLGKDENGNEYILTSFRIRFTEIPESTVLYINGSVLIRDNFLDLDLDIAKEVHLL
ncbi:hypothetical protein BFU36_05745 [Sulfolobus sp. A20]|uniref:hypothetical protein n=1 Tax=Sulfolobaceae TaxID=118883 RepID=UPI000845D0DD|nr:MULTISPECIES: hypothetical protein [unclassified Sulfolobus]TRM76897.1 hypothetical protein DJ528_07715 [Sulfolobus sp. B5]TRM77366.1 hypothetical protein DJ532_04845 [Sulfolobus sp. A20-N-F8]TRM85254.1 hypothetical protein DJ522_01515 [Sulfolobus sp. F3]TRM89786.1 hypothetical protein DJ529_00865 [Sulfolobus sp. C3]TRN00651.1 hypothetical protein DJ527_06860 [Sulfolobus sp. F1]TRN04212.1 hypothetical protein DJ530_01140 [Sulfolobus sp. E1]